MNTKESLMSKIIFVCYDQGAGGEHLAVEISKMGCCNYLEHKIINGRYISVDVTLGRCRYNVLPISQINDALTESSKWHVIPTHFTPSELADVKADKFFVCITTPSNEKHRDHIKSKVLQYKFRSILELKGQIEADGYDPKTILRNYTGSLDYQSLLCLYGNKEINQSNIMNAGREYMKQSKIFKFKDPIPDSINVEYSETILPNFYTDFTNTLHKQLTKSI